ncbi:uncharacterized protein LOC123315008 isoform X2 [Coccinella septempunctata]|uniref:uncharacterized protein LOC123315008 isoform X2 n=1 Tax=Coccinella septempunctata TaxID=41139 RepID=UPI001D08D591|nr:uncharacterized protein LOC123315008 isoform X2 [Coccinella septempunctata]
MPWTEDEKKDLLVALERHGPNNLEEIQKYLPLKSVTEIRSTIQKYKQMAVSKGKVSKASKGDDTPLNQWIEVMKTLQTNSQDVDDLYARLFKYIALFEDHTEDGAVNLRDCYLAISELMKGESIKFLDPHTTRFLNKCLTDLANMIDSNDNTSMINFVKSIENLNDLNVANSVKSYSKKKNDVPNNPLRVPESLLKVPHDLESPSTSSKP